MYALVYNTTIFTTRIKCRKGQTEHNRIWLCVAYNTQTLVRYGFTALTVLCLSSQLNRNSTKCLAYTNSATLQARPAEVESALINSTGMKDHR